MAVHRPIPCDAPVIMTVGSTLSAETAIVSDCCCYCETSLRAMAQAQPILGCKSTMDDGNQLYVKKLFDRGIRHQPDSYIITHTFDGNTHRMKYKEFRVYTSKLASALFIKYGIHIGDVVSTFCWNNLRHMALYYTIPCMGSVLNPLNIRLHESELSFIINHSQPKIIFIDENLLERFEKILNVNALNSVKAFIICGDNQLKSKYRGKHPLLAPRSIDYDEFIEGYGQKVFDKWPINLDERSGCFLNYTSGTTGNPKGIPRKHNVFLSVIMYTANAPINQINTKNKNGFR